MNYCLHYDLPYVEENIKDKYRDTRTKDVHAAVYHKVLSFEGNPDVCALPAPLEPDEMIDRCMSIVKCTADEIGSEAERYEQIARIKDEYRTYFPYLTDIELNMFSCIYSAYSKRKIGWDSSVRNDLHEGASNVLSVPELIAASVQHMSIIGTAGTGKSTAMQMVLSRFPKAIRHHLPDGRSYVQIPVLSITASSGDAKSMFISLAKKLDIITGNNVYAAKMKSQNTLPKMGDYLTTLVRVFHIAMIVIDEIQLGFHKASNMELLLNVTAEAAVSLCIIGTEESVEHLNKKAWFNRRFSQAGKVTTECFDLHSTYMKHAARWMFYCYPVKQPLEDAGVLSEELITASGGNIDFLSTIYAVCLKRIADEERKGGTCRFDKALIKSVADSFPYAGALVHQGKKVVSEEYAAEMRDAVKSIYNEAKVLRESAIEAAFNEFAETDEEIRNRFPFVYRTAATFLSMDERDILEAFEKLCRKEPEVLKLSDKEIGFKIAVMMHEGDSGKKKAKKAVRKKEKAERKNPEEKTTELAAELSRALG